MRVFRYDHKGISRRGSLTLIVATSNGQIILTGRRFAKMRS